MSRALFIFILLFAGLFYIFNMDKPIIKKFTFINSIKQFYVQQVISLSDFTEKYLGQAQRIETLKKENDELKKYRTLYTNSQASLDVLRNALFDTNDTNIELKISHVLSYVAFDDYTKVWIDFPKKDKQILGLISQNYAAGIVKNFAGKSLALLNGNQKANYAVYIGDNKAPGIVHGNNRNNLLTIKFIPIWMQINKGDEVITSGMDNIFFEGLQVGKVVAIKKMADMQEAIIEPYAKALRAEYFYVYKKITKEELPQPIPLSKQP